MPPIYPFQPFYLAMSLPGPLSALADFFFPARCLVCRRTGGGWLHTECRPGLPYISGSLCPVCGVPREGDSRCRSPLCARPDRALARVRNVFLHQDKAREAVLKLKYRGLFSLADTLAGEMAEVARREGFDRADGLVGVPLHAKRLKERGYNQAGLLARGLGHHCELKVWEGELVRHHQTRTQVGLGMAERAVNVKDAFVWQGPSLSGQTLLLVDDVYTTGATLNECALALKAAGADRVWALTLTRELSKPIKPNSR